MFPNYFVLELILELIASLSREDRSVAARRVELSTWLIRLQHERSVEGVLVVFSSSPVVVERVAVGGCVVPRARKVVASRLLPPSQSRVSCWTRMMKASWVDVSAGNTVL